MGQKPEDETPEPNEQPRRSPTAADARGVSQLTVDAVTGVTDIVEEVHRTITSLASPFGAPRSNRARGISGFVYRNVRRVTRATGAGFDTAIVPFAPILDRYAVPRRDDALAILNGVVGDHLAATDNPLAISMHLRRDGHPLALDRSVRWAAPAPGRLLVLAHGLCMDDRGWNRNGHDHGAALARDLGYVPLYLKYNSGRSIADNGRAFADVLERLVGAWPVPVTDLVVVGHSMGGLVARSASHYAGQADHAWLRTLRTLVFLGTPHHGAPLERAGNGVDLFLGASPLTAPFARLGLIRSAGVKDLRYGTLLDERGGAARAPGTHVPLPEGVASFAVAATKQRRPEDKAWTAVGDGLVPVRSALGEHPDPTLALAIPGARQRVFHGLGHFDLLSSHDVYAALRGWLAED